MGTGLLTIVKKKAVPKTLTIFKMGFVDDLKLLMDLKDKCNKTE